MADSPKKLLAAHLLLAEAQDRLRQLADGISRPPNGIIVERQLVEAADNTFTALCGALEDLGDGDVLGGMGRGLMHLVEGLGSGPDVGSHQVAVSAVVVRRALPARLQDIREEFASYAGPALPQAVSLHDRIRTTVEIHLQRACSELLERNTTGVMPAGVIREIATKIGGGQEGMSEKVLADVERYVVAAALAHAAGKPRPMVAADPDGVTADAGQEPAAPGM